LLALLRVLLFLSTATFFLGNSGVVLITHNITTFNFHVLSVTVVEVFESLLGESAQFFLILGLYINKGKSSGSLLVDNLTQAGFSFDNDVWDSFLPA